MDSASHELWEINKDIKTVNHARSKIPDDHSSMPALLFYLGRRHLDRFNLLHELDDLEKAIEYRTAELALTPDNDPGLSEVLFGLALVHGVRFKSLGDLHDIEKAIEYGHISIELSTDGDAALPLRLVNYGTALTFRFESLGEMTDLDDAIQHTSRALVLTPDSHPQFSAILNMLGMSHHIRFRHLGELNDIEKAIGYQTRALSLAPDGHPDLPGVLQNLGAAHDSRFDRLGELRDLEDAIEYQSRVVALTAEGDPDLPTRVMNLGVSHSRRFERLGELSDLENAIKYKSRALALAPDGHPNLPSILANLGTSYTARFKQFSELGDLEQADAYRSRALALIPDGHPDASNWQFEHAKTYLRYYMMTKNPSHSQRSTNLFRSASQSLSGAPRNKYQFAQDWAKVSTLLDPNTCIEAYQTAIDLLPQFIWLGATTRQRYQDLSMTEVLAMDAASVAIRSSDYNLALEWLEHTRCVVWNQSLMLRSPVDELQSIHPELGMRLKLVANQLQKAGSDSRESHALASGSITAEGVAQDHRRLAREYDGLLARIRALPGLGDFLRPMKAARLVQAARTGPVVVISCHEDNCDALIIIPGEETVGHLSLPNFSAQKAQEARHTLESSLRRKGIRERGVKVLQEPGHKDDMSSVLASLWHHIVKPILDHLGYMNNDSSDDLPHIIWCPTGASSFLPLHAAGDYTQPQSRVFDYVISSYTPTLTALLASRSDSLSTGCRVLAVGQANTPGHSALPGTTRELAYMRAHASNVSQYSELMDSQATVPAVLDAMEQHDWVHLACHAHQNVTDPTKSGFFLHEGTLDLAEINRRSFKGKGLAFLSACQTATGDEKLADEAVHLASGMLMAGYSSVIATMWSVHDEDAPVVADRVYAQLMKGRRLNNGEAGRALHNAVAGLRERVGEQKFERWVPYIHIGS